MTMAAPPPRRRVAAAVLIAGTAACLAVAFHGVEMRVEVVR